MNGEWSEIVLALACSRFFRAFNAISQYRWTLYPNLDRNHMRNLYGALPYTQKLEGLYIYEK